MLRTLARNAASNWLGFAVQVVITFFLTPFVLGNLGEVRYGIWALVAGLTGYYGLLDMGLRSTVVQLMARHVATRDFPLLNGIVTTAFVALTLMAGLVLVLALIVSGLAPNIFNIPVESIGEAQACIILISLSAVVTLVLSPFDAVFVATQRYDVSNVILISTRLLLAAATVMVLSRGYGLVALSVVNLVVHFLEYSIRWVVARRLLPEMKINLRLRNRRALRELRTFAVWNIIIQAANQLKYYSDALVVGILLPIEAVTHFALAGALATYFTQMFQPIATVFLPQAAGLDARGEVARLQSMFLVGSKILLLFSATFAIVASAWAGTFFRLWVGADFVTGDRFPSVALLFWILVCAAVVTNAQRIGFQVLMGAKKVKPLGLLLATEALVNLLLSIWLGRRIGLLGVALGTLIPAMAFHLTLVPARVCRHLEISRLRYFSEVWRGPLLVCVPVGIVAYLVRTSMPEVTAWPGLLIAGIVTVAATVPIALGIGLTRDERQRFLVSPVRRSWHYLGNRLMRPEN